MTTEVSKMLRLPRKLQRRKRIAPAPQNDFRHVIKQVGMSHSAAPATQNDMKPSRRGFAASPINTARPQENQRLETRHVGGSKRAFRATLPPILTLCSFKIDVFLKIDVSCEASINFHHIAQNVTPAMEFAPCPHLAQP